MKGNDEQVVKAIHIRVGGKRGTPGYELGWERGSWDRMERRTQRHLPYSIFATTMPLCGLRGWMDRTTSHPARLDPASYYAGRYRACRPVRLAPQMERRARYGNLFLLRPSAHVSVWRMPPQGTWTKALEANFDVTITSIVTRIPCFNFLLHNAVEWQVKSVGSAIMVHACSNPLKCCNFFDFLNVSSSTLSDLCSLPSR